MQKHGQGSYQFDIKETLRLSHEQIPIEEIEDMELVQNIECKELGENIEITGSLILIGNYKGNQDAGKLKPTDELPESFEESVLFEPLATETGPFSPLAKKDQLKHQIPIQITLPREKVTDIDEIFTYVSSFDYEVKTPYQMEVMASLIIGGLIDKEEPMDRGDLQQDQFEFVYTSGGADQYPTDPQMDSLQLFEEQAAENEEPPERRDDLASAAPDDEWMSLVKEPKESVEPSLSAHFNKEKEERTLSQSEEVVKMTDSEETRNDEMFADEKVVENEQNDEFERNEMEEDVPSLDDEAEREPEREDNVIPIPHLADSKQQQVIDEDEERDVRVAITNKQAKEESETISSLSSFFANRVRASEEEPVEASKGETKRSENTAENEIDEDKDAAYLGNFLEEDNAEQFTKVKICIIQKDETIDEIAERYELTVDAILRSNGTARNQVTPGQLLYIPVKG